MSMKLPLQDCSSWLASSRQAFRGRFYSATHVIQIYLSQLNQCLHITVAAQLASPFAAILASVCLIVAANQADAV